MKFWNLLKRETNGGTYIPLIDGMRFLAISIVILQHFNERLIKYGNFDISVNDFLSQFSFALSRGTIGVFIFFTLSGFILSAPHARVIPSKSFNYRSFLLRRLERLEPSYFLWMSVFAFTLILLGNSYHEVIKHWISSILYIHNIVYTEYSLINPVAWSLEVEVQYYLISPFISILYFSEKTIPKRRIIMAMAIASFMLLQHQFSWQLQPFKASLLGNFQHFLLGILLYDFFKFSRGIKRHLIFDVLFVLCITILALTWSEQLWTSYIFEVSLFALFFSAFRLYLLKKIIESKPIILIGGMCYTIYLIHLPILEGLSKLIFHFLKISSYSEAFLIMFPLAIVLILIISSFSFILFEKPFMKRNWWKKNQVLKTQNSI